MSAYPFSVVIPAYNRAAYIAQCLAPFTQPDTAGLDVIVVDDGSTDDTAAAVSAVAAASQGARITLIQQPNQGASVARNTGVAAATTPFVAFLDSDDLWFPWTVRNLQSALAAHPGVALLLFRAFRFAREAELPESPADTRAEVLHPSFLDFYIHPSIPFYGSCNVCVRRSTFLDVEGFDPAIRSVEDIDLFFRLSPHGPTLAISAPALMASRIDTPGSLSKDTEKTLAGLLSIQAKHSTGRFTGDPHLLQKAVARSARIGIWTLLDRGDPVGAGRLLRAAGPVIRRTAGLRYYASTLASIWGRRLRGIAGSTRQP